jgi:hypothetical protein
MSELAAGFRAGTDMAERAMATYRKTRQIAQLDELEQERARGLELQKAQAAQEQQLIQQGVPLSSALPVTNPYAQALNAPQGQYSPVAPPVGLGPQQAQFQQSAETMPVMSEQDYLRKQAVIFAGTGDAATAAQLRAEATGLGRQDVLDQRYRREQAEDRRRYEDDLGLRESAEERAKGEAASQASLRSKQETLIDQQVKTSQDTIKRLEKTEQGKQGSTDSMAFYNDYYLTNPTGDVSDMYAKTEEYLNGKTPEFITAFRAKLGEKIAADMGMNAQQAGLIIDKQVKPLESFADASFEDDTQAVTQANETIGKFLDSDPYDSVIPQVVYNEETDMYDVVEGDVVTNSYKDIAELQGVAATEIERIRKGGMGSALMFADNSMRALKTKLAKVEDQKERQGAYLDFLKDNPQFVGNEAMLKRIQKEFGVGGLSDVKKPVKVRDNSGGDPAFESADTILAEQRDNEAAQVASQAAIDQQAAQAVAQYTPIQIRDILGSGRLSPEETVVFEKAFDIVQANAAKSGFNAAARGLF